MGLRVMGFWVSGCRVRALGFGVQGYGFLGCRAIVGRLGFLGVGLGFLGRVSAWGCGFLFLECRVMAFGFLGCRVVAFGFWGVSDSGFFRGFHVLAFRF